MLSVDTRVFTSPVWTVRCSANPATSSLFVLYNKHAKAFREFDLLGHFPRYLFALCLCSSRYKMLFMMMMMMMWWCYCCCCASLVQFKCRFLECLSILMFDVCSCSVQYFYIVWTVKICTAAGIPRLVNANKLHVNFEGVWICINFTHFIARYKHKNTLLWKHTQHSKASINHTWKETRKKTIINQFKDQIWTYK